MSATSGPDERKCRRDAVVGIGADGVRRRDGAGLDDAAIGMVDGIAGNRHAGRVPDIGKDIVGGGAVEGIAGNVDGAMAVDYEQADDGVVAGEADTVDVVASH